MSYVLIDCKLDKILKIIKTQTLKETVTNLANVFNAFPPQMIPDEFYAEIEDNANIEIVYVRWSMDYAFSKLTIPPAHVELKLITSVAKKIPKTVAEGKIVDFYKLFKSYSLEFFSQEELAKMFTSINFTREFTTNLIKKNWRPVCEMYNYMYEAINKKYNMNETSPFTLEEWDSYE